MGFLKNLVSSFIKPQTFTEKISEEHPTSWYIDKRSELFMEILRTKNDEAIEAGVNLLCLKYFESFENIKALRNEGKRVDTVILGKELASVILKIICDDDFKNNTALQCFSAGQLLKGSENPYIRFVEKLNHNFYGEAAFYISQLIFLSHLNVDKDVWLYDTELFDIDPEIDEDGSKLFKKITPILTENNLFNEEIMNEIQENVN